MHQTPTWYLDMYFAAVNQDAEVDVSQEIAPAPHPGLPAEVHNDTRIDPEAAWEAVKAMCR